MKQLLFFVIGITIALSGCAQAAIQKNTKHVGGNCEGCESIYESPAI